MENKTVSDCPPEEFFERVLRNKCSVFDINWSEELDKKLTR